MREPLHDLEARRTDLYDRLAHTGDFRRGTLTATYRRCGKPNCACAEVDHPGHGPRHLLTRSVAGKTEGRQILPGVEMDKVSRELSTYKVFTALTQEIVEVNGQICEARPLIPEPVSTDSADGNDTQRGGSSRTSRRRSRPR